MITFRVLYSTLVYVCVWVLCGLCVCLCLSPPSVCVCRFVCRFAHVGIVYLSFVFVYQSNVLTYSVNDFYVLDEIINGVIV